MNKFTQPKKVLTADANTFSAVINVRGDRNFHATITSKAGYKVSVPGITAATEEALMSALQKLDISVKFYKKNASNEASEARLSKDAQLVEDMRNDPATKDVAYFNAAKRFGIPIQARPDFTATTARVAVTPVTQQVNELVEFEAAHPELNHGGFLDSNNKTIMQYLQDFNLQCTRINLEQALADLTTAGCIRSNSTGRLGGAIYRRYDVNALDTIRRNRPSPEQECPAGMSPADEMAWSYIRSEFPNLDPRSPAFKRKCSDQLLIWAKARALEASPGLEDKPSELRAAMDNILLGWVRAGNSNIGVSNKVTKSDRRVWLG
jgi:hypothetical protein